MKNLGFFGLTLLIIMIASTACSTISVDEFSKVRANMSKDDVLEALGSPNRTERIDGKEKWAYRFWTGPDKDVEVLKQVTFYNGFVVSFGDDKDEVDRLRQISDEDQKRAERKKQLKSSPPAQNAEVTGASPSAGPATSSQISTSQDDQKPTVDEAPRAAQESDFVEMRGRRTPVKSTDSNDE